jgi:hypothetical protein
MRPRRGGERIAVRRRNRVGPPDGADLVDGDLARRRAAVESLDHFPTARERLIGAIESAPDKGRRLRVSC